MVLSRLVALAFCVLLFIATLPSANYNAVDPRLDFSTAHAADNKISEKEAFESAKELGTIEAWDAFLNRFSTGFRADLARAYVKRLGGASSTPPENEIKAEPTPLLDTFTSSPGDSSWRTLRYKLDHRNSTDPAAAVSANGVELLLYCNHNKRFAGIIRQSRRGESYPEFEERIRQGLDGAQNNRGSVRGTSVPIDFSNGASYTASASFDENKGELLLGLSSRGGGFRPDGDLISDMMSETTVTISAPPFGATLQLSGSRNSICEMANKCGASVSGCGTAREYSAPATSKPKKTYTKVKKKKKKTRSCRKSGGKCSRNSQCCSGKCCTDDFEICEGWYGKCT